MKPPVRVLLGVSPPSSPQLRAWKAALTGLVGCRGPCRAQGRKGSKPLGGDRPLAESGRDARGFQPLPCPRAHLGNGGMESTEAGKQGRKEPLPSAPGSGSSTGAQKCC